MNYPPVSFEPFSNKSQCHSIQCHNNAAEELKADAEIALAVISQDTEVSEYVAEELKTDREFILLVVSQDGRAFEFVSEDLQADREIAQATVTQFGKASFVDEKHCADKEIIIVAASQDA